MTKPHTGNIFFDTWLEGTEQIQRLQAEFLASSEAASSSVEASDVMQQAKESWQKCEEQFNSWQDALKEWLPESANFSQQSFSKLPFNVKNFNFESMGQSGAFSDPLEYLQRLMNPSTFLKSGFDEFNQAFQRMADIPEFADIGMFEKKFMLLGQDWIELRKASASYQSLFAHAWTKAFDVFSGNFEDFKQQAEEDSASTRKMIDEWLKTANDHLINVQRSPEFLDAQKALFKATTKYKLKQQELIELWCEQLNIPSRTEIDDLHKKVHDMRVEMRILKKQLSLSENKARSKQATKKKVKDS